MSQTQDDLIYSLQQASGGGLVLDSTTALAANATFKGTAFVTFGGFVEAEANSDQTGTLYVDFSEDNFVTIAFSISAACGAPSSPVVAGTNANSAQIKTAVYSLYARTRFTNGAVAQTAFQVAHRTSTA